MLKYFESTDRLSPQEWQVALETFEAPGQGSVTLGRRRLRFQQVYDRYVDRQYADCFILYWEMAFARGYHFELVIFRDLRASGIAFVAHDLRQRAERRSPYDLIVLRQVGDSKSKTCFLFSVRSLPLHCDFYITRLYCPRRRRYVCVVMDDRDSLASLER